MIEGRGEKMNLFEKQEHETSVRCFTMKKSNPLGARAQITTSHLNLIVSFLLGVMAYWRVALLNNAILMHH